MFHNFKELKKGSISCCLVLCFGQSDDPKMLTSPRILLNMLFNWFIHHCFCQLGRIFWAISTQRSVKATFEEWDCHGLCSETSIFSFLQSFVNWISFSSLLYFLLNLLSRSVCFTKQIKFFRTSEKFYNLIKCWKVIIWLFTFNQRMDGENIYRYSASALGKNISNCCQYFMGPTHLTHPTHSKHKTIQSVCLKTAFADI